MDQPAELALLYDVAVPVDPERSIHIADDEIATIWKNAACRSTPHCVSDSDCS